MNTLAAADSGSPGQAHIPAPEASAHASLPPAGSDAPGSHATDPHTDSSTVQHTDGFTGHVPDLHPSQAAALARQLFGLRCACRPADSRESAPAAGLGRDTPAAAGGAACAARGRVGDSVPGLTRGGSEAGAHTPAAPPLCSGACCTRLPGYDDRNFLVRLAPGPSAGLGACVAGGGAGDDVAQGGGGSGLGACESYTPGPGSSPGPGPGAAVAAADQAEPQPPGAVVVKVHHSADSGPAQLARMQAADEAMRWLLRCGVLTNTPLRPVGRADHAAAGGGGALAAGSNGLPAGEYGHASEGGSGAVYSIGGPAEGVVCWVDGGPCSGADQPVEGVEGRGGTAEGVAAACRGLAPPPPSLAPCAWALLPCCAHLGVGTPAASQASAAEAGRPDPSGAHPRPNTHGPQPHGPPRRAAYPHPHPVRCLAYLPGSTMASLRTVPPGLLRSLGRLVGRTSAALAAWTPAPALRAALATQHRWHLGRAAGVVSELGPGVAAFDREQKALLADVACALSAAAPALADVPCQVCHGDANDDNVLVSDDGAEAVGLIDFGDMAIAPRVCEVSIAMLYAMLWAAERPLGREPPARPTTMGHEQGREEEPRDSQGVVGPAGGLEPGTVPGAEGAVGGSAVTDSGVSAEGGAAPDGGAAELDRMLEAGAAVLSGFRAHVSLTAGELRLLPLLLRARAAQSLCLGTAAVAADPGNAAYLLQTQRPGWRLLRLLAPGAVPGTGEEGVLRRLLGQGGGAL